jgi:hypothetical protein
MEQGKCPACGKKNSAVGFCAECDSNIKNIDGIDCNEFLDSLPEEERLIMKLPLAIEIAQRLQSRPLLMLNTR